MITLHISSGGRNVGQVELPIPLEDFKQRLYEIRDGVQAKKSLRIFKTDSPVPALGWHLRHAELDQDTVLEKLNRLAEAMEQLDTGGLLRLGRALSTEFNQELDTILQTAASVRQGEPDCYESISGVTDDQALGKWLVDHGRFEVADYLRPHLNYDSIGAEYRNAHNGASLTNGYAGVRPGAVEQAMKEEHSRPLCLTLSFLDRSASLGLPASEAEMRRVKEALEIDDFSDAVIAGIEYTESYLTQLIPRDCITVEDANELAFCLEGIKKDGEMKKYCAALEVEEPSTFSEAVNIAIDIDDYELVRDNEQDYAWNALRRMGASEEVTDAIQGYTDFEEMGRDMMEEDGVRQTGFGQILRLSKPFPKPEIGPAMC